MTSPGRGDPPVDERELRERLRAEPDDPAARERSWRVVQAAFAEREPRRRWQPRRGLVAVAAVLVPVVVAGVAVGAPRWVRDAFEPGEQRARPALVRVPGGGSLLVESGGSTWVVSPGGARRRLGAFAGASWSPRGLFVVAWRGRELTALEPDGDVRWSLSAPAPVTHAAWSPVDGFRIAYVAGGSLRVVTGDGKDDRRYASARGVTPAWRPDDAHVLAYVDRRERINVVAVDSGRRLWRTQPLTGVTQLAWAPGDRKLLAAAGDQVTRFDSRHRATGATIVDWVPGAAYSVEHIAVAAGSGRIALVRAADSGRREVRVERAPLRERLLFTARGPLPGLAWSPDGRRLLVPWPDADQWIFLRPGGGGRPVVVANIARQFMPGASEPAFPDSVQWCCPEP